MFCENCGKELLDNDKFCSHCGTPVEINNSEVNTIENSSDTQEQIIQNQEFEEKHCQNCGSIVLDGEKYCIKCGILISGEKGEEAIENYPEINFELKHELKKFFQSNTFLGFIWKYATILVLFYSIYIILGRIDGMENLVEMLDNISIISFYLYYIGIIALYSKSNYVVLLSAILLRLINSFIILLHTSTPFSSISRIIFLIIFLTFLFKEFKRTEQYQKYINYFRDRYCTK